MAGGKDAPWRPLNLVLATMGLSLAVSAALLAATPAVYEARVTLKIPGEMMEKPIWLVKDGEGKADSYQIVQTAASGEEAVRKANRLAAFFIQRSQERQKPTPPPVAEGTESNAETEKTILGRIEKLETEIREAEEESMKTPSPPLSEDSSSLPDETKKNVVRRVMENPDAALTKEEQGNLGLALPAYRAHQESLREKDRMKKIYGPLHPKWERQKRREEKTRKNWLQAIKEGEKPQSPVVATPALPLAPPPLATGKIAEKKAEQAFLKKILEESRRIRKNVAAAAIRSVPSVPSIVPGRGAEITAFAALPWSPVYPLWGETLALTLGFALLAGVGVAAYDRRSRPYFLGPREMEEDLGLPCFGRFSGKIDGGEKEEDPLFRPCGAELAARVRALRNVLQMLGTRDGFPPRVFLILEPEETTEAALLALWLGRIGTRAGNRVLLMDADFHGACLTGCSAATKARATLPDYLAGQARAEDILDRTTFPDLHMAPAAIVPNSAADLLGSAKLGDLVLSLRRIYETILIVAPAGPKFPEFLSLCALADQILLCVAEKTPSRRPCQKIARELLTLGLKNACTVLLKDFPKNPRKPIQKGLWFLKFFSLP